MVNKLVLIASAQEGTTTEETSDLGSTAELTTGQGNAQETNTETTTPEVITNETATTGEEIIGGILPATTTETATTTDVEATTEATNTEVIIPEAAISTETTNTTTIESTTADILQNPDAKIIIRYSLDGQNWQILDTISSDNLSNALNGGYFSYDAPFLKNWDDVKNLKIKFEGVIGGETKFTAYLDSLWVEADYQEKEKKEEDEGFELVADKKDWRADETPTFHVVPKGEIAKVSTIGNIINDISSFLGLTEEPKVEATLIGPTNEESLLLEEKDFTAETHSPTVITILRQENFRPGLHKLEINYEKDGKVYDLAQEFTWGVLVINTNKSIYLPNDQAYLQMAALAENGRTLCDARLSLEITAPDGTKTIFEISDKPQEPIQQETIEQATSSEEQVTTTEEIETEATSTTEEAPTETTATDTEEIGAEQVIPAEPATDGRQL